LAGPVDDFLAKLPEPQRAALEDLRRAIRAAAPGSTELINYGVPMFRLNGRNLVSFAAGKDHCSFYVQSPAVMDAHAADLTGFKTSKGTVQFTPDGPIPVEMVTKLVKARIAENESAAGSDDRD
jgi:uncharacterized protein YdhG (YjbR/CyaY superfamily)